MKLDRLPDRQAERLKLIHGSLIYRDKRLEGFDAAAVVEVTLTAKTLGVQFNDGRLVLPEKVARFVKDMVSPDSASSEG